MAVCGDPAGVAAYQYVVYIALGAVILATPFIAVMHYGNDKPAAVMATAASHVVQLVVHRTGGDSKTNLDDLIIRAVQPNTVDLQSRIDLRLSEKVRAENCSDFSHIFQNDGRIVHKFYSTI